MSRTESIELDGERCLARELPTHALIETKRSLQERLALPGSDPKIIAEYTRMLVAVESELQARLRQRDRDFAQAFARALILLACILVLCALAGCASTPDRSSALQFATPAARNAQVALTGLMALDTAQTVTIARSPECLSEGNQVAAYAFGSRTPSPERVLLTNALYIAGHWALGSYLDRKASQPVDLSIDAETDVRRKSRWQVLQRVYQFATGFGHAFAIKRNAQLGIKPFSNFACGGAR